MPVVTNLLVHWRPDQWQQRYCQTSVITSKTLDGKLKHARLLISRIGSFEQLFSIKAVQNAGRAIFYVIKSHLVVINMRLLQRFSKKKNIYGTFCCLLPIFDYSFILN